METIAAFGALAGLYVLLRRDIGECKRDLKSDIARLEERLVRQGDRLDARIDAFAGEVNARFDSHDRRFDALGAKVDLVRGELINYLGKGTPPAA